MTVHAAHALKPYEYTAHGPGIQFCCDGGAVPAASRSAQKALATGTSTAAVNAQNTRRFCTPVPHDTEHVDQACDENVYFWHDACTQAYIVRTAVSYQLVVAPPQDALQPNCNPA